MKNKCNVAKDLMPLVIDGVASEESQQYVDEHINECTECALTYGAMRVELPRANQEKERAEMEKAARKLRRKRILRGVAGAVMGILIFLIFNLAVPEIQDWSREEQFVERYVCENGDLALDALYYDVSQLRGDLRVQVDLYSFPSGNPNFSYEAIGVPINDNTAICVQYRAYFDGFDDENDLSGLSSWYGRVENGVWVGVARELSMEARQAIWLPIVRIELHADDEYVVLWELGDELHTPEEAIVKRNEEMNKYRYK